MKRCVVPLAILALAGCATYRMGQARDAGPIATLESARLPVDMAQCVETTWQLESLFGTDADAFTDRDGKGRFTVSNHASTYFADIEPNGRGSLVRFYGEPRRGEAAQKRQATLATCL